MVSCYSHKGHDNLYLQCIYMRLPPSRRASRRVKRLRPEASAGSSAPAAAQTLDFNLWFSGLVSFHPSLAQYTHTSALEPVVSTIAHGHVMLHTTNQQQATEPGAVTPTDTRPLRGLTGRRTHLLQLHQVDAQEFREKLRVHVSAASQDVVPKNHTADETAAARKLKQKLCGNSLLLVQRGDGAERRQPLLQRHDLNGQVTGRQDQDAHAGETQQPHVSPDTRASLSKQTSKRSVNSQHQVDEQQSLHRQRLEASAVDQHIWAWSSRRQAAMLKPAVTLCRSVKEASYRDSWCRAACCPGSAGSGAGSWPCADGADVLEARRRLRASTRPGKVEQGNL